MATQVPGKSLLLANYGTTVNRAAAALPATTTTAIFSVTGGRVLVTNICGQVATALGATVTTVAINYLNTASTANLDIAAAVAVTSAAVGTMYGVPSVGSAGVVAAYVVQNNEFILPTGSIRLTTSATNTGTMTWSISYIPLDAGAAVVAV